MEIQNKTMAVNCLACGAELSFDPRLGKLHCEFCDSEFTVEEIEEHYKKKEEQLAQEGVQQSSPEENSEWGEDADNMRAYSCSSCGAELIADENTSAMRCPYCGNNTIVPASFSGALRPDCMIPFSFTKEQAEKRYSDYYKSKKLLPKSFSENNHVEEIQGVYVPFWLFSGTASVDARYEAYDRTDTPDEEIRKYYSAERAGHVSFKDIPVDASKRMPDDLMDSVEPYKHEGMKDFSMSYLPGFMAERFNVSEDEDKKRAQDRIENTAKALAKKTVHHDHVKALSENVDVEYSKTGYALLPVWYLVTKWNDKTYRFAMNGQTGAFIGDLPIDTGKMVLRVIIWAVIAAVIAYFLFGDGDYIFIIAGVISGMIGGATGYASMKPVARASRADSYINDPMTVTKSEDVYTRTVRRQKNRQ